MFLGSLVQSNMKHLKTISKISFFKNEFTASVLLTAFMSYQSVNKLAKTVYSALSSL